MYDLILFRFEVRDVLGSLSVERMAEGHWGFAQCCAPFLPHCHGFPLQNSIHLGLLCTDTIFTVSRFKNHPDGKTHMAPIP